MQYYLTKIASCEIWTITDFQRLQKIKIIHVFLLNLKLFATKSTSIVVLSRGQHFPLFMQGLNSGAHGSRCFRNHKFSNFLNIALIIENFLIKIFLSSLYKFSSLQIFPASFTKIIWVTNALGLKVFNFTDSKITLVVL